MVVSRVLLEETLRHACGLPRVGHDVRQATDEIIKVQPFAGPKSLIRDTSTTLNVNCSDDLLNRIILIEIHRIARVDSVPIDRSQDVAVVINRTPCITFFVQNLREKDLKFFILWASLDGLRLRCVTFPIPSDRIAKPRKALVPQ